VPDGAPRPESVLIDDTPLTMPLKALDPIDIQAFRRTAEEPLFNSLMEHYHYLAYEQPVGEHLTYLARTQGPSHRTPGVEFRATSPAQPRPYIGWSAEAQRPFHRL